MFVLSNAVDEQKVSIGANAAAQCLLPFNPGLIRFDEPIL